MVGRIILCSQWGGFTWLLTPLPGPAVIPATKLGLTDPTCMIAPSGMPAPPAFLSRLYQESQGGQCRQAGSYH